MERVRRRGVCVCPYAADCIGQVRLRSKMKASKKSSLRRWGATRNGQQSRCLINCSLCRSRDRSTNKYTRTRYIVLRLPMVSALLRRHMLSPCPYVRNGFVFSAHRYSIFRSVRICKASENSYACLFQPENSYPGRWLASCIRRPMGQRIWHEPLLLRISISAYHIILQRQGVIG